VRQQTKESRGCLNGKYKTTSEGLKRLRGFVLSIALEREKKKGGRRWGEEEERREDIGEVKRRGTSLKKGKRKHLYRDQKRRKKGTKEFDGRDKRMAAH